VSINFRNGVALGHSVTRRYTRYRPWVPKFIARKLGSKRRGITIRRHIATMPPMRLRPLLGYERRRPFYCCDCDHAHPNGAGSACVTN
jgi:hypothetical protein